MRESEVIPVITGSSNPVGGASRVLPVDSELLVHPALVQA